MKIRSMFIFVSIALLLVLVLPLPVSAWAGSSPGSTPRGCGPSNVTASFQGVTIRYSCFEGSGYNHSQESPSGAQLSLDSGAISSHGSSVPSMWIDFSSDPSCHFATGAKIDLRDPCVLIYEYSDPALPSDAVNFTSSCSLKGGTVEMGPPMLRCFTGMAAKQTSGTIILTRWRPSALPLRGFVRIAFHFSAGAQVTGYYASPGKTGSIAVPLAGSATAVVDWPR